MHDPEQKIIDLDLQLPPAPKPMGVYTPFLISGNHVYVSDQWYTIQATFPFMVTLGSSISV